jgi:hypothetical protein
MLEETIGLPLYFNGAQIDPPKNHYSGLKPHADRIKDDLDVEAIISMFKLGIPIKTIAKKLSDPAHSDKNGLEPIKYIAIHALLYEMPKNELTMAAAKNLSVGGQQGYDLGIGKLARDNPNYLSAMAQKRWNAIPKPNRIINDLAHSRASAADVAALYITEEGQMPMPFCDIQLMFDVEKAAVWTSLRKAVAYKIITPEQVIIERSLRKDLGYDVIDDTTKSEFLTR